MTSIRADAQFSSANPIDGPAIFSAGDDKYHPLMQMAVVFALTILSWAALIALGHVFGIAVPISIYLSGAAWLTYELANAPALNPDRRQSL